MKVMRNAKTAGTRDAAHLVTLGQSNIAHGTTDTERDPNDAAHTSRMSHLKDLDSNARFISFEPLLNALGAINFTGIARAIVDGESGPGHGRCDGNERGKFAIFANVIRVEFFFKQGSDPRPKSGRIGGGRVERIFMAYRSRANPGPI